MNGFAWGLAVGVAVPALWLVVVIFSQALSAVVARVLQIAFLTFGSDTQSAQRARVAAVIYSARKSRMLTVGSLGFVMFRGIRSDEQAKAYKALNPPISLKRLGLTNEDES